MSSTVVVALPGMPALLSPSDPDCYPVCDPDCDIYGIQSMIPTVISSDLDLLPSEILVVLPSVLRSGISTVLPSVILVVLLSVLRFVISTVIRSDVSSDPV